VSSRFHWLFSGEISNYRIRIHIYLFTSSIIEEFNLVISPINNLIVLCDHNQIAIGGQNNRQIQIPWLLIYYVHRLNLNQAISYSDNQNIFGGNMLLCLRCHLWAIPIYYYSHLRLPHSFISLQSHGYLTEGVCLNITYGSVFVPVHYSHGIIYYCYHFHYI
jgi:hypothetical protein